MARQFIYKCDGCDRQLTCNEDKLPEFWAEMEIRIEGYTNSRFGGRPSSFNYPLLCPVCQTTLRDNSDPSKWTRLAEKSKP